jgi:hypothetical protein
MSNFYHLIYVPPIMIILYFYHKYTAKLVLHLSKKLLTQKNILNLKKDLRESFYYQNGVQIYLIIYQHRLLFFFKYIFAFLVAR